MHWPHYPVLACMEGSETHTESRLAVFHRRHGLREMPVPVAALSMCSGSLQVPRGFSIWSLLQETVWLCVPQISGNTLSSNCVTGGVGGIGVDFSTGVAVSGNTIQATSRGLPGLKTQNNLGPCEGLSVVGNTFSDNGGVAVWLFCNDGCTSGAVIGPNTLTGNAATGNECGGQVQVDNPGANVVLC